MAWTSSPIPLLYFIWIGFRFSSGDVAASARCIETERKALLSIRTGISDAHEWLSSWDGKDCCSWAGVECNAATGHVIKLDLHNPGGPSSNNSKVNPSLLELKHLSYLDLSGNYFDGAPVPGFIGSLTKLEYLFLSSAGFGGTIPESLGSLSELVSLGLDLNRIDGEIPATFGDLRSLQTIDLSSNNISGEIPEGIGNLSKLQILRLSDNKIGGAMPASLGNLSALQTLDLSNNEISEQIPDSLANLYGLEYLRINGNNIGGAIPSSMGNLCNLSDLDASENRIKGQLTGFIEGLSRCRSSSIWYLRLQNNEISGAIPSKIGKLQSLIRLNLGSNSLSGPIPASLGNMVALSDLNLSSNSLVGALSEANFANLTRLDSMDLSHNLLTVNESQDWLPPFQATEIRMGSCNLGPKFPPWLKNQTKLSHLDLSSNGISDAFPDWFWELCLSDLILNVSYNHIRGSLSSSIECFWTVTVDLSHNNLEGFIPKMDPMLMFLDLSYNLFSGPIPPAMAAGTDYLAFMLLSNNRLNGTIPSSFCEANHLQVLNLANNGFSGTLPDCWKDSLALKILDVSGNKVSGDIPETLGLLPQLKSLHLNDNGLSGRIPSSLQRCKDLVTIDLGQNKLSGVIPRWIGDELSSLRVLRLRSNMFTGAIPPQLSLIASLQVLDLARNDLSGELPPSFGNFSSMISVQNETKSVLGEEVTYYTESTIVDAKGLQLNFTTVLSLVTSIDLSGNNLSGEIPEDLTKLHGLHFLNLSDNKFSGGIPQNIGAIEQLESLDLSENNLSGRIPSSISALNFLSHLNLSYNNFSGRIPSGSQLRTFTDPSIYASNPQLCGSPLLKKCPGDAPSEIPVEASQEEDGDEDEYGIIWFFVGFAPGFVVGFWGFMGTVMIDRKRRIRYIQFLDMICSWLTHR
ncbi:hypothetical protein BHE74_00049170 [Ensete ventricosum]|nr:hypothetical protein BHE74_00049170 [Ensete ventricosum]